MTQIVVFALKFCYLSHVNNYVIIIITIVKPRHGTARDANCLSNRVVNFWNCLPDNIVTAESVSCFKRRLNGFDLSNFILF